MINTLFVYDCMNQRTDWGRYRFLFSKKNIKFLNILKSKYSNIEILGHYGKQTLYIFVSVDDAKKFEVSSEEIIDLARLLDMDIVKLKYDSERDHGQGICREVEDWISKNSIR